MRTAESRFASDPLDFGKAWCRRPYDARSLLRSGRLCRGCNRAAGVHVSTLDATRSKRCSTHEPGKTAQGFVPPFHSTLPLRSVRRVRVAIRNCRRRDGKRVRFRPGEQYGQEDCHNRNVTQVGSGFSGRRVSQSTGAVTSTSRRVSQRGQEDRAERCDHSGRVGFQRAVRHSPGPRRHRLRFGYVERHRAKSAGDGTTQTIASGLSSPLGIAVDAGASSMLPTPGPASSRRLRSTERLRPLARYSSRGRGCRRRGQRLRRRQRQNLVKKVTRRTISNVGSVTAPMGIAVDASGNSYVTDGGMPSIVKIAPGGRQSRSALDLCLRRDW